MRERRGGRRLVAGAATLLLVGTSLGTAGAAHEEADEQPPSSARPEPYQRIDPSGADASRLPSAQREQGVVTVMVEAAGAPVARQQADARKAGRAMSNADRERARGVIRADQDRIRRDVEARGGQVLFQVQDVYNGLRVRIDSSRLSDLAAIDGVVGVHDLPVYERQTASGVPYINANDVWQDFGATGAGTRIAIIDSGIDYYHRHFGGSGDRNDFLHDNPRQRDGTFPTPKVIEGFDFAGDDFNAVGVGDQLIPNPDPDPLDCGGYGVTTSAGHGTHVAGIAAGIGVLSDGSLYTGPYDATTHDHDFEIGPGVAPEASLLAYRVFGCVGSTNLVVEAVNQAVVDGADVINLSLGVAFGDSRDIVGMQAVENATAAGAIVVAVAGNDGRVPYIVMAPGAADHALSVAALDANPAFPSADIALSGSLDIEAINANGANIPDNGLTDELLVLPDGAGGISLGCDPAEYAGAAGKIVVAQRGVCARIARAQFGDDAGAVAVVLVNNEPGLPPVEGRIKGVKIPFLGVPSSAGAELLARDGESATITDGDGITNPAFGMVHPFSSIGPRSGDSAAKPDVSAPGVSVVSALVGRGTEGVPASGTSMATPHTAGATALVAQRNPGWSPAQIRAAIMNTANRDLAPPFDVRQSGTGAVDVRRAIDTPVIAMTEDDGASLSFGYEQLTGLYSETKTIVLTNRSGADVTYAVGFERQDVLDYSASAPTTVTVPAGGQAAVPVTLSLTPQQAAALPAASADLVSAHGAVTLSVTGGTAYDLRVAYLLVPQTLSDVVVEPAPTTRTSSATTVTMANRGVRAGDVALSAWTHTDPADLDGLAADVRAVGVSVLPGPVLGLPSSDRSLLFTFNTWNRWSSASGDVAFGLSLDTGGSSTPEFFLNGNDLGKITTGRPNGVYAAFLRSKETLQVIDVFVAEVTLDGSTIVLPVAASSLGLSRAGTSSLRVASGFGYSLRDYVSFDRVNGSARIRPWSPTLTQGSFETLEAGDATSIELRARQAARDDGILGWLFATFDDRDGPAQADLIPLP